MIANPPVINVDGDITVHSKSSMALSIAFKDAVGAARDMSALTVYFSTSSGLHILMTVLWEGNIIVRGWV
jgi:hypothetical protein